MSEEKQPKFNFQEKGKGGKKGPKFNIYWIYGVVIVGLLVSQIMNFSPELKKTTEQEFKQQMLLAGDVTKLDFVKNKDEVQVYINGDSLKKEFYVKKFGVVLPKEKVKGAPLFVFEVLDWKSFDENLKKIEESITKGNKSITPFSTPRSQGSLSIIDEPMMNLPSRWAKLSMLSKRLLFLHCVAQPSMLFATLCSLALTSESLDAKASFSYFFSLSNSILCLRNRFTSIL